MTWRRIPETHHPRYLFSLDDRDPRILAYGWTAVTLGVLAGSAAVGAMMDTALAFFAVLIFCGIMVPIAGAAILSQHEANQPEDDDDGAEEPRITFVDVVAECPCGGKLYMFDEPEKCDECERTWSLIVRVEEVLADHPNPAD